MLRSPTVEKLQTLHLHGLLAAWEEQERHPEATALAFAERLGLLVDAEWTARENRRELQRLKTAKLKLPQACVEDLDFRTPRGLEKALVRSLATCQWLTHHQNLICVGPSDGLNGLARLPEREDALPVEDPRPAAPGKVGSSWTNTRPMGGSRRAVLQAGKSGHREKGSWWIEG